MKKFSLGHFFGRAWQFLVTALAPMRRSGFILGLGLLLALSACKTNYYSWREKLILTVETPTGVVTGFSINQLDYEYFVDGRIGGNSRSQKRVGEAVVVDLGQGRYLFALLPSSGLIAYNVFSGGTTSEDAMRKASKSVDAPARPIKRKHYPQLVTFGDIDDPASVMRVDPADLAATFGPGFALREVTLEVTDEPVTEGVVEGVLGWLEEVGRKQANLIGKPEVGLVSDQPDPGIYMISSSDFSTELFR